MPQEQAREQFSLHRRKRGIDLVESTDATISRRALAPVDGQGTSANADRLIKPIVRKPPRAM